MAADPPKSATSSQVTSLARARGGSRGSAPGDAGAEAPERGGTRGAGRVVPAAASSVLYDIVSGPFRPSRILGVSRSAVYLEVEGLHEATVIALLARDAVRLPNGLVLVEPQSVGPFADVASATSARIGRCSAVFDGPTGSRTVHAGRWWRPPVPRAPRGTRDVAAATAELGRTLGADAGGLPARTVAELEGDLSTAGAAADACARLVGSGPGLTPSGDDLLCGYLLAARHLGPPAMTAPLAAAAAERAAGATTALSASLLTHAAAGRACPQAVALLDALGGRTPLPHALRTLRTVGHTSGTDLALGMLAGARAALRHRPCPNPDTATTRPPTHSGSTP